MLLIPFSRYIATLALAASPVVVFAQTTSPPVPQIISHGRGEVEIAPDRAEILWQVVSRARTGAAAADANAIAVRAVLDTLRRGFRLTEKDLVTAGYSLQPQMVYPGDGKPPQVTGYVATNTVRVRTDLLGQAGALIDAAIAKGATSVGGLSFYAANADESRRRALAQAVERSRLDAEAMAVAAGGRLGQLLELSSEFSQEPRQFGPMMADAVMMRTAETPVQPSDVKVAASVTARWQFVSGR